jgi:hypothetical protein
MGVCSAKQRSADPANLGQTSAPKSRAHRHYFLSHVQRTGGDQANVLYYELQRRGKSCWYDQRASDVTLSGMRAGIENSDVFLLFLSKGVFTRPFVRLEIRHALRCGKPVLQLHETQPPNAFDFSDDAALQNVPVRFVPLARHLLRECESIGWERRGFKLDAVVAELERRHARRDQFRVVVPPELTECLADEEVASEQKKQSEDIDGKEKHAECTTGGGDERAKEGSDDKVQVPMEPGIAPGPGRGKKVVRMPAAQSRPAERVEGKSETKTPVSVSVEESGVDGEEAQRGPGPVQAEVVSVSPSSLQMRFSCDEAKRPLEGKVRVEPALEQGESKVRLTPKSRTPQKTAGKKKVDAANADLKGKQTKKALKAELKLAKKKAKAKKEVREMDGEKKKKKRKVDATSLPQATSK